MKGNLEIRIDYISSPATIKINYTHRRTSSVFLFDEVILIFMILHSLNMNTMQNFAVHFSFIRSFI